MSSSPESEEDRKRHALEEGIQEKETSRGEEAAQASTQASALKRPHREDAASFPPDEVDASPADSARTTYSATVTPSAKRTKRETTTINKPISGKHSSTSSKVSIEHIDTQDETLCLTPGGDSVVGKTSFGIAAGFSTTTSDATTPESSRLGSESQAEPKASPEGSFEAEDTQVRGAGIARAAPMFPSARDRQPESEWDWLPRMRRRREFLDPNLGVVGGGRGQGTHLMHSSPTGITSITHAGEEHLHEQMDPNIVLHSEPDHAIFLPQLPQVPSYDSPSASEKGRALSESDCRTPTSASPPPPSTTGDTAPPEKKS